LLKWQVLDRVSIAIEPGESCAAGATLGATMKLVATIAALGLAGISTSACAQECKGPVNIPIDDPISAQTAKCLLSIDNRLLVNERCQVLFLPDGSEVVLDAGKHYARLSSTVDRRGVPVLLASWNRGSGRNDRLTPLGFVKASKRESVTCWRNRRVKLCTSNYMTCECQSDSYYRCLHEDDMKQQAGEAAHGGKEADRR
jgi:hypothetical protein